MTSIANPDYWSLLGIKPGSNQSELKAAFRREARKWHPDLNGNNLKAEERFKLVNEAYAVLSDPVKRASWERKCELERLKRDPFSDGFPSFEEYIDVVLGINSNIESSPSEKFNNTNDFDWPTPTTTEAPPPPVQAFEDLESLVQLTPTQALNGCAVQLELEDGTLVEIRTPPFAGDGWRLRLPGVANGGRDHYVQLRVMTDEGLRIDGLRVLYRLELFPPDAVLGCAVEVPTLEGNVTLQVPPNSSSGRLLRLRGRGMEFEGATGDQLVEIVVVIPSDLRDSERALYERLHELSGDPDII